jgi:hypothetical protein
MLLNREQLTKLLPEYAFVQHPNTSETVAMYPFKASFYYLDGISTDADARALNRNLGITESQAWVFTLASVIGWEIPEENGKRRKAWVNATALLARNGHS